MQGAPTASAHLARLANGGLVAADRQGRQRYYRLANPAVVSALEVLAAVAPPAPTTSPRDAHLARGVRLARTCYDHLAGMLGVHLTEALVAQDALRLDGPEGRTYSVPDGGRARFAALGVDVDAVTERARRTRRPLALACLDWSERRPHLAGALGAALAEQCLTAGWVERTPAGRALRVTNAGRRALRREFDLQLV